MVEFQAPNLRRKRLLNQCSLSKPSLHWLIASAGFLGAHAQCPQNAGYLGAFEAATGNFVGAVGISLGRAGMFTPDETGNTTNYLSVVTFTNTCNDGGPVFIQIRSLRGTCAMSRYRGHGWIPHGPCTTPETTRTTLQGEYHNLKTFCGECMTFALGNAVGRQVFLPQWKNPNSDSIFVRLLATPNVQAYSRAFSNAVVQQVYLSVFLR
ncbi:hypothetical protein MVEN_00798800 [Mycena venus]|uniref:Uncharacterized protein n=1 Tax=Mycena venus TaxID=2733690 RepID=A0A8H7D6H8_9AGAR|nr:hypothetical protein MVEN_00798800 [Mycena venus]